MKQPTKQETKIYLNFATTMAKSAGKILKDGFSKSKDIRYKGQIDPVTKFDVKSEKYIIGEITKKYPAHSILAEEGTDKDTASSFCWVVDPLDGTVNYAHRFPVYSVSIALMFDGKPLVGVVYDPEADELFSAGYKLGVTLNGKKIKVSNEKKLNRALLATGFAYNIKNARLNNLGHFSKMMKKAQAVRRLGSAALDLCWLAAGRLDGFWEFYLHPWDTAAAILIVTEAGGKVTTIESKQYSIFNDSILASNGQIHKQMKDILLAGRK